VFALPELTSAQSCTSSTLPSPSRLARGSVDHCAKWWTAQLSTGVSCSVGSAPDSIAITPDGELAYVADSDSNEVTPIDLATDVAETPIAMGSGEGGPEFVATGPPA
jgi:YVTN family beta-propeller protein